MVMVYGFHDLPTFAIFVSPTVAISIHGSYGVYSL